MKKFDKVLIVGVLVIAFALIGYMQIKSKMAAKNSKSLKAEISVKGKVYKEVVLSKEKQDFTIETELGKNVIKIHDSGIEVTDSNCRDHICEKTGFISKPGEVIVCLPNKVIIKIEGEAGVHVDGVSK